MDRNSKYFLGFVALVIVLLVGYKFKQFIIDKDFTLIANIPCDTKTESCFKVTCDPVTGCDASSGIVNADGSPYKKVTLPYSKAPNCLIEEDCTSFSCEANDPGDPACKVTTCVDGATEDNGGPADGEECIPVGGEATTTPATDATTTATTTPAAN